MHMPAVQAFWCLVSISDKYLEGTCGWITSFLWSKS
jgi:hypothetical protein